MFYCTKCSMPNTRPGVQNMVYTMSPEIKIQRMAFTSRTGSPLQGHPVVIDSHRSFDGYNLY